MKRIAQRTLGTAVAAALVASSLASTAQACSRVVYLGPEGQTITGRTMDWVVPDIDTNLWLTPRGTRQTSNTKNPVTWTVKHGSVAAVIYNGASADGMNEKGLVANLLYLTEAAYEPETPSDTRPTLAISAWAQYMLDNYATVAEAVAAMRAGKFRVITVAAPSGQAGLAHLSISDASGDSAIFEYVGGKLAIHHSRDYQVMTNEPPFEQQLGLTKYWGEIGGSTFIPGTNRASDRFVRASYYVKATTQTADPRAATAAVLSIMRNVSVPKGITTPGRPNVADTLWITIADQKNKTLYFQDTNGPGTVWVNLAKLDFAEGSGTRMLQLDGNPDLAGNQTANFKPAKPYAFLVPH